MTLAPPGIVSTLHGAVLGHRPLVHCVTNVVAATFSANALLALGASPAMVEDADEAAELAATAGALVASEIPALAGGDGGGHGMDADDEVAGGAS